MLEGWFDIASEKCEAAKAEIRDILIEKAKQRTMVTHSELVVRVKAASFNAFDAVSVAWSVDPSVSRCKQIWLLRPPFFAPK